MLLQNGDEFHAKSLKSILNKSKYCSSQNFPYKKNHCFFQKCPEKNLKIQPFRLGSLWKILEVVTSISKNMSIPPSLFIIGPLVLDPVPQTSKRFRLQGLAAEVLRHLGGVGDMGVVDLPTVECQPSHEGFK